MERGPLKLFFSYAHEDLASRDRLDEHLDLLRRQKVVVTWSDALISPGKEWREVIEENMRAADLILLLLSRAFMRSEFVNAVEIPLAMAEHERGTARVLPVLLEPLNDLRTLPFAQLEVLPTKAHAVSEWLDPVRAFADIADGVKRAATDIIWARGGPFEFGPHQFTDAELVELDDHTRRWVSTRLADLHDALIQSVPPRRVDGNVLVASWSMLGRRGPMKLGEFQHYVAQTISAFDIVTLEEVYDDLSDLERVLEILGPDWDYLVTDISQGALGNLERFAIVYYSPRVEFAHVSGEVVLLRDELIDDEQFARKPLLASFRAAGLDFRICTAHLTYGKSAVEQTAKEAAALARHLVRRATRRDPTGIVLSANLNLRAKDSAVVAALRREGVHLPDEMLHPSVALSRSYAGAIGFVSPRDDLRLGPSQPNSGVFDVASVLFPVEHSHHYRDKGLYEPPASDADAARHFLRWGALNLSEHLPLWAELAADDERPTVSAYRGA